MEIVPKDRELKAIVRISSKDIGHVRLGAKTTIKMTTYDYGRYGGIFGELYEISPTTSYDEKYGPYFNGTVLLKNFYVGTVPNKYPVLPGMTLEAERS